MKNEMLNIYLIVPIELTYRIGTLLFGPSSELAKRKASGQLIHDAEAGALLCGKKNNQFSMI